MALKGNLRDFSLTQLLNLINLARKTGTLLIEDHDDRAVLSFREGSLSYAQLNQTDNSLATVLHKTGKISQKQYQTLKARADSMTDKELGLLLINANFISQREIINSIKTYSTNILKELFTWDDGFFYFQNRIIPTNGKILVRVPLENIILEGSRKEKEWEYLQDEIPSLDMTIKFIDKAKTNIHNLNLSKDEWRVIKQINAQNTIRQIAQTTNMNDLQIRRVVYSLLQAGLIQIVRPKRFEDVSKKKQIKPMNQHNTKNFKSLVNRLVKKVQSL
jgi:predicted transcriptional regulator